MKQVLKTYQLLRIIVAKEVQKEVSQMANHNFPHAML